MNTKFIMTGSALIMGIFGATLIFLPDDLAGYVGISSGGFPPIILQILGSLYFAFAMLNWMGKANLIGGIYSRPVAVANFTHFFVGGLALLKIAFVSSNNLFIWIAAIIYAVFAILFALVLFTHPVKKQAPVSDKE